MTENTNVIIGRMERTWQEGAKSITFCVTETCNLACKYCYMTGKNKRNKKMKFETAKKVVDYILSNRELFKEKSVIWDFVGGEPLIEIDLIDKISDYIKYQMYIKGHPWFNSYRFSMSTNGLLYDDLKVQEYIAKNRAHLSIGLSVDGNKIKHDMQRIKLDGSGSYDDVMKVVPLWQSQFPGNATKATFSHDDIPHLKDSVISLWENGIPSVSGNVVFEDVWHEGDDILMENQLKELADYVLENHLWDKYSVRFFDPSIGFPLQKEDLKKNFCGAGKMLAIDTDGNLFPCLRFWDISLENKENICIGNIDDGINSDKLRPFLALTLEAQSPKECIECEVASGCSWCTGFNYNNASTDTIYQRATFNCKMHKATVRANEYFWERFEEVTGLESLRANRRKAMGDSNESNKYLQIIVSDNITPHCNYKNKKDTNTKMSDELFEKSMEFANKNGYTPIILGDINKTTDFINIVDSSARIKNDNTVVVHNNNSQTLSQHISILLVSKKNIDQITQMIGELTKKSKRINIILQDIEEWTNGDLDKYDLQLAELKDFTISQYKKGEKIELNILTDRLDIDSMCNCDAGNSTISVAPNGKFYICPAFYFDNEDHAIGDLNTGVDIKNKQLLELENAPICSECDAYHCRRCKFMNKKLTSEINTPSRIQCLVSHKERNKAMELQRELVSIGLIDNNNTIPSIDYMDPLDKIIKNKK